MIQEAIKKVVDSQDLTAEEAAGVMGQIMEGRATDAQIACLITALRMKGETAEEIYGFARTMRSNAVAIPYAKGNLLDTCGTGGDLSHSFNISTTAAFVAAGAGAVVAKHGNRSVSSKSGSADVLEALGVNLNLTADQLGECLETVGMAFLFAPALHPAMKHAAGVRKETAIRSIFNILGPLSNPAKADYQVLGVYDPALTETLAEVLGMLGVKRALVVHGSGLDELSISGTSKVSEFHNGQVKTYLVTPEEVGLESGSHDLIKGGDARENAGILRSVLSGEKGARRNETVFNSAAALLACGIAENLGHGVTLAQESIDSGKAIGKLDALIAYSQSFS